MFEELNQIGDVVAEFIKNMYGRETTNFYAEYKWLRSKWLKTILNEKFGINRLTYENFEFDTIGPSALIKDKRYSKKRIFNVEKIREYLNKKYTNIES